MHATHKLRMALVLMVVAHLTAGQTVRAADCNNNGIDDVEELAECPTIDVVFLIDTSFSEEGLELRAVCSLADAIVDDLGSRGLTVNAQKLAIGQPPHANPCECCEDTVPEAYCPLGTEPFCDVLGSCEGDGVEGFREDWGPATSVVAENKSWGPGPRVIVPISDEGPRCGNPVQDPGADRDALEAAMLAACTNQVMVLPVVTPFDTGNPVNPAVLALARDLAAGGGRCGKASTFTEPNSPQDLASEIADAIESMCPADCNGNDIPDECEWPPGVLFVDMDRPYGGTGRCWVKGYDTLQDALAVAAEDQSCIAEIWVAEGQEYRPDRVGGYQSDDREATFQLVNGIAIYGGFSGDETAREQRDPSAHPTILTGNIGDDSADGDNSYHVLTGSGVDATAVLDGFTITAGNANGGGQITGGGMLIDQGSPTVRNCTFSHNYAEHNGGGCVRRA